MSEAPPFTPQAGVIWQLQQARTTAGLAPVPAREADKIEYENPFAGLSPGLALSDPPTFTDQPKRRRENRTTVSWPADELEAAKEAAEAAGVPLAAFIREAVQARIEAVRPEAVAAA